MTDAEPTYEQLPARTRRRLAGRSLLRSGLVSIGIFVGYFVLPMDRLTGASLAALVGGLTLVGALLVWQVREVSRSPYPRVRVIGALATSVPLFFVVFATTYYLMGRANPGDFTEPMSRLDAVYYTVTIFATVGFGDIAAVSETARAVVTVQMVGDLTLIGLVARTLLGAVQTNLSRHQGEG